MERSYDLMLMVAAIHVPKLRNRTPKSGTFCCTELNLNKLDFIEEDIK